MKIIAITQARVGSTRLPGKVLKPMADRTMLEIHLARALKSKLISSLIVATTMEPEADRICDIAKQVGARIYRGSTNDVLDRYYQAASGEQPDYVVRITSDCPLNDGALIDELIGASLKSDQDFFSNTLDPNYPDGMDIEIMKFSALEKAWKEATMGSDREHVTPYIWRNSDFMGGNLFTGRNYYSPHDYSEFRLTVDEQPDFDLVAHLVADVGDDKGWMEYVHYLQAHPEINAINSQIKRNEGHGNS